MIADAPRHRVKLDDRLLVESVAAWEQITQTTIDDRRANERARDLGGPFETRLVHRAAAMPIASQLIDAMRQVRSAIGLMLIASLAFAALGGVATARAALGTPRDEPVNFYHVIAATLMPQTILLLAWLTVMFLPRKAGTVMSFASLGGAVMRLGQWLSHRIHPGSEHAAAVVGISRSLVAGSLGRWTFSSISHALWLVFNFGCLGMMIFLLSTRQYAFAWETTILSERTYQPLTNAIAALPRAAGFGAPDDPQIESSMWSGGAFTQDPSASQAWSSLLVGSIIMYGLAPRLLLLLISLGQRRFAKSRYRIDIDRPEFARLRNALEPDVASLGVIDGPPESMRMPTASPQHRAHAADAPRAARAGDVCAIVGFELPASDQRLNWPPMLHGVRWQDLGMIDSREDRHRAINDLTHAPSPPASIVIVCSLTTTPDRGVSAFLGELVACVSSTPVLVLTGGHRLRERATSNDFDVRINDWRTTSQAAGIRPQNIVEIDFEHFTRASQAKLAQALGTVPSEHEKRLLEAAFDRIAAFAHKHEPPHQPPDHRSQADLLQEIAHLHDDAAMHWRDLLNLPAHAKDLSPARVVSHMQSSAQRFTDLLPPRLRSSPMWIAAGATAGALACVAAAAMISPIAIGALPMWSGIGAAVSAAINFSRNTPTESAAQPAESPGDLSQPVRSAALFAMLLEVQRFDERTITRILDQAISDDDHTDSSMPTALHAQQWLDDLRHRFDLALAKEASA